MYGLPWVSTSAQDSITLPGAPHCLWSTQFVAGYRSIREETQIDLCEVCGVRGSERHSDIFRLRELLNGPSDNSETVVRPEG